MTYQEFIQNIIDTRGQWNIPDGKYFERHHIIPICLGGKGDYKNGNFKRNSHHENCIWLYAREHFIAHKLLAEENPGNYQLALAWEMMAYPKGNTSREFEITAEEYDEIRCALAICGLSEEHRQKIGNSNRGKIRTEETKQTLKDAAKNRKQATRTPEWNKHISESNKLFWENMSEEEKQRRAELNSLSHKGKKLTEEHKKKISAGGKGKHKGPLSEQHKKNISTSRTHEERVETASKSWETRRKNGLDHVKAKPRPNQYKPVICVETNKLYKSIGEAEKETGATRIGEVCKGIRSVSCKCKLHWRWATEDEQSKL